MALVNIDTIQTRILYVSITSKSSRYKSFSIHSLPVRICSFVWRVAYGVADLSLAESMVNRGSMFLQQDCYIYAFRTMVNKVITEIA